MFIWTFYRFCPLLVIRQNILGKRFHFCPTCNEPSISLLMSLYECPPSCPYWPLTWGFENQENIRSYKYNILTLGTAERQTIFFASGSTLKNIADVSGDSAFTCFRAPSSAWKRKTPIIRTSEYHSIKIPLFCNRKVCSRTCYFQLHISHKSPQ